MEFGQPVTITGTGPISPRGGKLIGFYVNSTTAGTIALADASGAIGGTITPAVGWHFYPAGYVGSLSVVVGGTINVTFLIKPV
jgi:hypothetical protein